MSMFSLKEAIYETALDLFEIGIMSQDEFDSITKSCHMEGNPSIGSDFDDFLEDEGILEEVEARVIERK